MWLCIVYVAFLAVGWVVCFVAGDLGDSYDTNTGLMIFLALFFLNLWVSWRLAVAVTAPKKHLAAG